MAPQGRALDRPHPGPAQTGRPLAGPILGIAAHELSDRISNDIELTQALLDDIRGPGADRDTATSLDARGPASRAGTDADFGSSARSSPNSTWLGGEVA